MNAKIVARALREYENSARDNGQVFDWLFPDPLPVGSAAPDFTANDEHGRPVTLSRLRGHNVVLVFYPGDDTPTCTKQLCEFRDRWSDAQSRNALVFGVNPASASSHERFRGKYTLPFPILIDQGRRIASLYNCNSLIIRRTVYLIGPDGSIRYAVRGKPQVEDVLRTAVVK
jgi:peroxiredoxin Q/BCP